MWHRPQDEFDVTESEMLMYRRCMHQMVSHVAQSAGSGLRLWIDGPVGSGKSIALASLVGWARASGWLALYVPSADALMHGGFYYR
jgi:small subunit ribosomal protein S29